MIEPQIQWIDGGKKTAGPGFFPRLFNGAVFRENAAEFLQNNLCTYGDLVCFKALGMDVVQFNHPDLVQEMLVRDARFHHRSIVMQRSKAVLGEGLLTSEEPLHMRQRRLAQPAFHRQRIAAYGEVISHQTNVTTAVWTSGTTRDVRKDMLLLALRIVGKTLFDTDVEQDVHKIAAAVDSFQGFLPLAFLPFSNAIQRLPIPAMEKIRRGRTELDELIYRMIAERRADPADRGDLLSMLLASEEADESGSNISRMSDVQVRDECLTVLLAGHETTANALSFALWLLAENIVEQEKLAEECRNVLAGRSPTAMDYGQLGAAERVFSEALRLYPPVWVTARTAAETYMYRGMTIRKGTVLIAPQFAVHRDSRWWDEPEVFDPERFTAEAKAARPKLAYFPFGAGGRQCIGEGLAWMEGVLALASIVQKWRLLPSADAKRDMRIKPSVSLRPKGPVMLKLELR